MSDGKEHRTSTFSVSSFVFGSPLIPIFAAVLLLITVFLKLAGS